MLLLRDDGGMHHLLVRTHAQRRDVRLTDLRAAQMRESVL